MIIIPRWNKDNKQRSNNFNMLFKVQLSFKTHVMLREWIIKIKFGNITETLNPYKIFHVFGNFNTENRIKQISIKMLYRQQDIYI